MKIRSLLLSALMIPALCIPSAGQSKIEQKLVGSWHGSLDVGQVQLRIVVHLTDSTGELTSTMDSPDQGANGIPVDSVLVENTALRLVLLRLAAGYEGSYHTQGDSISGNWTQAGMNLPLNLKRGAAKVEMNRPQEPKDPLPYEAEEITFENPRDDITLAGTLTRPRTGVPFPAVIMITGSGPQNRDEEVMTHKPFLVIADYLTRNGIAVLRFDDRGVAESEGDFTTATSRDFASDVEAAYAYLKRRNEFDNRKIGLIGHSEGGMIAPLVAAENKRLAFIVLLAGTGVPGDEIIALQERKIMEASGSSPEEVEAQAELRGDLLAIATSDKSLDMKRDELTMRLEEQRDTIPEERWAEEGLGDVFIAATAEQMMSPWMQFFLTYDPVAALKRVECPVLAMNGELDLQVIPDQNLPPIEQALIESGNKNYKIVELEGLNHLFQHATTGSPMEYSKIEETFAPEALELMTKWILEIVK